MILNVQMTHRIFHGTCRVFKALFPSGGEFSVAKPSLPVGAWRVDILGRHVRYVLPEHGPREVVVQYPVRKGETWRIVSGNDLCFRSSSGYTSEQPSLSLMKMGNTFGRILRCFQRCSGSYHWVNRIENDATSHLWLYTVFKWNRISDISLRGKDKVHGNLIWSHSQTSVSWIRTFGLMGSPEVRRRDKELVECASHSPDNVTETAFQDDN